VRTTMIYTHVVGAGALAVRSPADRPRVVALQAAGGGVAVAASGRAPGAGPRPEPGASRPTGGNATVVRNVARGM
jgi:hypothetical protein